MGKRDAKRRRAILELIAIAVLRSRRWPRAKQFSFYLEKRSKAGVQSVRAGTADARDFTGNRMALRGAQWLRAYACTYVAS